MSQTIVLLALCQLRGIEGLPLSGLTPGQLGAARDLTLNHFVVRIRDSAGERLVISRLGLGKLKASLETYSRAQN